MKNVTKEDNKVKIVNDATNEVIVLDTLHLSCKSDKPSTWGD